MKFISFPAYTESVIDELTKEGTVRLTELQALKLKDKLRGLYLHLKDHPALMERRLYVGSQIPEIRPFINEILSNAKGPRNFRKGTADVRNLVTIHFFNSIQYLITSYRYPP